MKDRDRIVAAFGEQPFDRRRLGEKTARTASVHSI
jgi:hypothetical protein